MEKLAALGARVVASDIDEGSARETASAIGGQAVGLRVDVTSKESVEAMVKEVMDHFGRVDVLVNNAGWDKEGQSMRADDPAAFLLDESRQNFFEDTSTQELFETAERSLASGSYNPNQERRTTT